ncbi:MAG: formylglycine-generating enzyme family protein, partial [Phormidesmis sp.]
VMGKDWLTAKDAVGNRRLDNPADWVRLEVEAALERNVRVIPVLLDSVEMPLPSDLPESLQPLAYRNAARVRQDPDFIRDMDRVAGVIRRYLEVLEKTEAQLLESALTFEFDVVTISSVEKDSAGNGEIKTSSRRGKAEHRREDLPGNVSLDLVRIPEGEGMMGSEERDSEQPVHRVKIAEFWIGKYPVTQAQWKAVAGLPKIERDLKGAPSEFKGDNRPVEKVSWYDAVEFCQRLSQQTGQAYRLPSEAEWEYACRAGTKTPFYFGETLDSSLANYNATETYGEWVKGECRKQTTNVGLFPANAFGLYDMHGNVLEWCADCRHENYRGAPTDGSVWLTDNLSDKRIIRGGSWGNLPRYCRFAYRVSYSPVIRSVFIGFRVSCSAPRT